MDALHGLDLDVHIHGSPNEVAEPIPFDRDEVHRAYDAAAVNTVLARARAERPRVQALPFGIHRQVQSGASLLGRARSGRDAFLRPARAGASGRHSQPARSRHARGLLARGQQLRILGGRRGDRVSRVLRLRVSGAGWFCGREGRAERRRSTAPTCTSSSCRTTSCGRRTIPTRTLLEFLQSTYVAAADLAKWDRAALESSLG